MCKDAAAHLSKAWFSTLVLQDGGKIKVDTFRSFCPIKSLNMDLGVK